MQKICNTVVFSDKAYNAIISESFIWDPKETGGFLLGQVVDSGTWYVIEALPPGFNEGIENRRVIHDLAYFEANVQFFNYLATVIASEYKMPLKLLGIWHRHPGSMDFFSGTDDVTNAYRASHSEYGSIISGLVNIDPRFRLTMRHVNVDNNSCPIYNIVDVEVGTDLIPEEFLEKRYYEDITSDLHPLGPNRRLRDSNAFSTIHSADEIETISKTEGTNISSIKQTVSSSSSMPSISKWFESIKKKNLIILIIAVVCFLISLKPLGKNIERINKLFDKEVTSPCGGQEAKEQASNNKTQGDTPTDVREPDNIDNQESVGATNENQKE